MPESSHKVIANVDFALCKKCVQHAGRLQEEDFSREIMEDEPVIVNLIESNSGFSS
jgi:hypothetical protein